MKGIRAVTRVRVWSICAVVVMGCAGSPQVHSVPGACESDTVESWGVELLPPRLSAGGYMIDFRYRVVDPEKALPLLSRHVVPYLIDQKSGVRLLVPSSPKVGPLRQTSRQAIAGRVYFILFGNPGVTVGQGDKITLVLGDFRAQDLVVQ